MPEIIVKLGDNIVQKYFFVKETMGVGRAPDNEIVIENLAISRNHAVIKFEEGKYSLIDLGSSNGSYVNGVKVKRTELMDKDVITLGKHKLFFYDQRVAAEPPRRTAMLDADRTMLVTPTLVGQITVTKGRQKGQTFSLDQPSMILGKGPECQIQLNDWFVSRQHAVIEKHNDEYTIRDLNSWRHTRVNGEVVDQGPLASGDIIQLGPTVMLNFRLESSLREVTGNAEDDEALLVAGARQAEGHYAEEQAEPTGEMRPVDDWVRQYPRVNGNLAGLDAAAEPETDASYAEDVAQEDAGQAAEDLDYAAGEADMVVEPDGPHEPEAVPADDRNAPHDVLEDMVACSVSAAADEATGSGLDAGIAVHEPAVEATPTAEADPEQAAEDDAAQAVADEPGISAEDSAPAALDPKLDEEIRLWERALQNPSSVIRKQAARRLKQLTGKDYAY
jgi:pSer/pThr/pTyr-binding forkhead associated (FHA) protein